MNNINTRDEQLTCYCGTFDKEKQYFSCKKCARIVHPSCVINQHPGGLEGDVFFDFICLDCAPSGIECYSRENLPCRRKKNWTGTVSGTLSHFNGIYFQSGTEELHETGWWRLKMPNQTPFEILLKNSGRRKRVANEKESSSSTASSTSNSTNSISTPRASPSMTRKKDFDMYSSAYVEPSETLSGYLFADEEEEEEEEEEEYSTSSSMGPSGTFHDEEDDEDSDEEEEEEDDEDDIDDVDDDGMDEEEEDYLSSAVASDIEVDIGGGIGDLHDLLQLSETKDIFDYENAFETPETILQLEDEEISTEEISLKNLPEERRPQKKLRPPLFKLRDKNKPLYPWLEEEKAQKQNQQKNNNKNVRPMTEYEELELLNHLKSKIRNCEKYPHILRLYRKLVVRKEKRERGLPLFDIDRFPNRLQDTNLLNYSSSHRNVDQRSRILDRFLTGKRTFPLRIVEFVEPREFVSPYTQRILKPYIRRDTETMPPWLKVMYQLLARVHRKIPDWRPPFRFPIDYCYLRPHHVPAVNSLLCEFFYPGIDVTECLEYPDFTCVCLYKKLVIGFACMVPDTGYNEAYISFIVTRPEWRRSKIATFMIYHLIQTCLGKDITLHVSATNTAMILYQQFGFKSEEFIKDFYDKYLPIHSRECRHAFFLRLPR